MIRELLLQTVSSNYKVDHQGKIELRKNKSEASQRPLSAHTRSERDAACLSSPERAVDRKSKRPSFDDRKADHLDSILIGIQDQLSAKLISLNKKNEREMMEVDKYQLEVQRINDDAMKCVISSIREEAGMMFLSKLLKAIWSLQSIVVNAPAKDIERPGHGYSEPCCHSARVKDNVTIDRVVISDPVLNTVQMERPSDARNNQPITIPTTIKDEKHNNLNADLEQAYMNMVKTFEEQKKTLDSLSSYRLYFQQLSILCPDTQALLPMEINPVVGKNRMLKRTSNEFARVGDRIWTGAQNINKLNINLWQSSKEEIERLRIEKEKMERKVKSLESSMSILQQQLSDRANDLYELTNNLYREIKEKALMEAELLELRCLIMKYTDKKLSEASCQYEAQEEDTKESDIHNIVPVKKKKKVGLKTSSIFGRNQVVVKETVDAANQTEFDNDAVRDKNKKSYEYFFLNQQKARRFNFMDSHLIKKIEIENELLRPQDASETTAHQIADLIWRM
jgi:hypothetical protein